jgi:hypothetical protein
MDVMDKIKYMLRMRDWFQWVSHLEDVNNPTRWKSGNGYYGITTMNIIYTLNGMIGKYSIGCTMEDRDRDTLNLYREFYNRNKEYRFVSRTSIDSLITTI